MSKTAVKSNMAPQMVVENVRLLPLISVVMYSSVAVLAYIVALAMDHVGPIFPFISHAVAYPPQSALGVIFGAPAALLAMISLTVRYVVTDHRVRTLSPDHRGTFERLNKAALYCGFVWNISALIVMLNPIGFPSHEIFDMVMTIGVPHHLGDFGVLICFTAYVSIETYLTYSYRSVHKQSMFIQFALVVGVIASVIGILVSIYPALSEIFFTLVDEKTGVVQLRYKKYSFMAAMCAVSEWSFAGMCLLFIATFYRDFKNVKIKFHLKYKS